MKLTAEPEKIYDSYIYLDWNVFKYMKENRTQYEGIDKEFFLVINEIKKRYRIPISPAHIKDRMSRFSEKYIENVKEDFVFVDNVCEGDFITQIPNYNNKLGLVKADIKNYYVDYLDETENLQDEGNFDTFISNRMIDLNAMDTSHPMYSYLKENQGN